MGHQDIQTMMPYVQYQPRHGVAQLFTEAVRHMAETDQESVRRVPNRVPNQRFRPNL